jgi:hypothetical protein
MALGRVPGPAATLDASDLLTPDQVATLLHVRPKTLANMRTRREGPPYVRVTGGLVRYSRRALTDWLSERATPGGAA